MTGLLISCHARHGRAELADLSGAIPDCRLPLPLDLAGFFISGPRRHGCDDKDERLIAEAAELKPSADWNRETYPSFHCDNFLPVLLLAPHLTAPAEKEPNLLDRPMRDSNRSLPGSQLEVHETSPGELKQCAYIRSIRGNAGRVRGKPLRVELALSDLQMEGGLKSQSAHSGRDKHVEK